MNKLYRQIELTDEEHDEFVFPHVMAMTGEKLHSKAEIAEELGVRDKRIAELEREELILNRYIDQLESDIREYEENQPFA